MTREHTDLMHAINDVSRRRFLQAGGLTAAGAAVLAACGNGSTAKSGTATSSSTTTSTEPAQSDIDALRTASALELAAVEIYKKLADSGVVKSAAMTDAIKLFGDQHQDHAKFFQGLTRKLGGHAYTDPSPTLMAMLEPQLAAVKDEPGAMLLALQIERLAAATHFSGAGHFTDTELNVDVMSVGGVEARHVALLAGSAGQPPAPAAFQTKDGALAAGSGL